MGIGIGDQADIAGWIAGLQLLPRCLDSDGDRRKDRGKVKA